MSADDESATRAPQATADDPEGNPFRSLFAVISGFVVLWILGALYVGVLGSLAGAQFPGEGPPTTVGLALLLLGIAPNGIVAGLLTGRVAGFAPIVHAAVLGGLVGFVGMMSSDQAQGMPWWFALGRIVLPTVFVVLGGAIARVAPRRAVAKRA
ncbi:MAG: hypothetical protein M3Y87_23325 [Myxococcota bacterium]|nr:hypothetical protein [Myxococcota bacterium]